MDDTGTRLASLLLVASLATFGCATGPSIEQAERELDMGNYAEGVAIYRKLLTSDSDVARQGAQFRLASMALDKNPPPVGSNDIEPLLVQATKGPLKSYRIAAYWALSTYYLQGIPHLVEPDPVKAAFIYDLLVKQGEDRAKIGFEELSQLPEVYIIFNEHQFEPTSISSGPAPAGIEFALQKVRTGDICEANRIFDWHARHGNDQAQTAMSLAYLHGICVEADIAVSNGWTRKAAMSGNDAAQLRLGLIYYNGEGVYKSHRRAGFWWGKSAAQGNLDAINNLGVLNLHPVDANLSPNTDAAAKFFKDAADRGHSDAMVNLADILYYDVGTPDAVASAKLLYTTAADSGASMGRLRLIELFDTDPDSARPARESTEPLSPTELFKRVSPFVRRIVVVDSENNITAQGSAVAVERTLLATNCHVIEEGKYALTLINDSVAVLTPESINPSRDLCSLRSTVDVPHIQKIRHFNTLEVGETVYAVGSPENMENTFSAGLVSGLRNIEDGTFIQTTASITHGSSGGGLFDTHGNLVGITTLASTSGNLNFAIPANELRLLQETAKKSTNLGSR